MRRVACIVTVFAFCGAVSFADVQTRTATATTVTRTDLPIGSVSGTMPVKNAAVALLQKRVDSVTWFDETFEQVIEWLKEEGEGKVNVVPRWTQLDVDGVSRDDPVTLQLNNTTVQEVLGEVLLQLNDEDQIAYRAIGNTLRISTKADFTRKLHRRAYNVTDMLFRIPDFQIYAQFIDLQRVSQLGGSRAARNAGRGGGGGGGGGGGAGGQGIFSGGGQRGQQNTGGEEGDEDAEETLEELRQLIMKVVAPASWEETQGGRGQIVAYDRSLVIYNTVEVHETIAGYFSYDEE